MINPKQLRELIIQPTLRYLEPQINYSEDAVELLMMTAAHESHLGTYIQQVKGPAQGIYQMEPSTEEDIHRNFLEYKDRIAQDIAGLTLISEIGDELQGNLYYATAMARVHYYRVPEKLPSRHDVEGMAKYAKRFYNSKLGKATANDYAQAYRRLVLGEK